MGMPARRMDTEERPARRAHLRLVPTPPPVRGSRSSARARARAEESRARAAFTMFAVVLACVIALGGARVTLITQAAEASLSEGGIQAGIKAQRAEADQLEVDRSALSTPSRIASIASATMKMGEPRSVRYFSLPDSAGTSGATGAHASSGKPEGAVARAFGAVMDLSAGEAQSLLVGDLGLAGSR